MDQAARGIVNPQLPPGQARVDKSGTQSKIVMMDERIHNLLKDAFSDFAYESAILFGSRARGDFAAGSDYDVLVITRSRLTIREKMNRSAVFRRKLADEGIDADIILKSRDEIDYYRDKIGSVVRMAVQEGVAL